MATSETRARPRKTGISKAAKAPASRKAAPAYKAAPAAKKAAPKKKAAPVKKAAPAKKGAPVKKAAPRKSVAKPRSAKPAATKSTAKPPRTRTKPVQKVLDATERLRKLVLDALDDLKAKDVTEVDVRGKSGVTDLLVVASGTSSRHVKSIADEVVKKAKQAGLPPIGVEGQREAEWVLVDLGDVIVHVMLPRTREFYGLERLWTVGDRELATAV